MSTTKRHHFIPIFYLKQFTDVDGFFYIYDVKKNEFKDHGRKFAPSQQFFEHYGNTTYYGGNSSDFIEHGFAIIDSKVSEIIKKITIPGWTLLPEDWTMLQYFVNIMYWRNPVNVDKVKSYIQRAVKVSDFELKGGSKILGLRRNELDEVQLLKRLKVDPEFPKFLKLMLPGITYPELFDKEVQDNATISEFPGSLPKLISDNPIIYRRSGKESLHTEEFIFPVTPTQILIRHKCKKIQNWSWVRIYIDILSMLQANQYIAVTDKSYPMVLKEHFNKYYTSIEQIRDKIYSGIIESD